MAGMTNKLKAELLTTFFRAEASPANFAIALVTNTSIDPDVNTMADLTEVVPGNGYTSGGQNIDRGTDDFIDFNEDNSNDKGTVTLKEIIFAASSGPIPISGAGPRFAVLTDRNVTVSNRKVYLSFDLQGERTLLDTQELHINGMSAELLES